MTEPEDAVRVECRNFTIVREDEEDEVSAMERLETSLEVCDPRSDRHGGGPPVNTAPRLHTLEGKTIGLLWNAKANGDVALHRVAELILAQSADVKFKFYSGSIKCDPALIQQLIDECDAAIGCTGDCGSCTSWMTHDLVQIERAGLPTVLIASHGFEHDVEVSGRAFGMPDPYYVVVPEVYNNLSKEQSVAQTDPVVDEVVAKLTIANFIVQSGVAGEPLPMWTYQSNDPKSLMVDFNRDFMSRDWGDGYPI